MSKLPFPERVLRQHIATLGKTGAGKSSAMRVIAEHLLDANRRVAIVDGLPTLGGQAVNSIRQHLS